MLIAVTVVSALVPSVLLAWFFRSRDAHPEPSSVVWATFGLGVAAIFPTLLVALPASVVVASVGAGPVGHGVLDAFFCAALPEEAFKLAVLLLFAGRHRHFDEPMDGVVYGVIASLGFATLENVMYSAQGGLGVALMRAFSAVPMHACCGAVMGYHVGRWRFPAVTGAGAGSLVAAYVVPVAFHGVYDAPLLAMGKRMEGQVAGAEPSAEDVVFGLGALGLALGTLALLSVWTLVLVARARREQREALATGQLVPMLPDLGPSAPEATTGSRWAWLLLVGGFCLASLGALVGLVGAWALLDPSAATAQDRTNVVLGAAVLGVPALLLGVLLFVLGLRWLPRPVRRTSLYAAAPRAT